jgi:hypothetical protein
MAHAESFLALLERLEKESKPIALAAAPSAPKGKLPAETSNPPTEISFQLVEVGRTGAADVIAAHPIPSLNYIPPSRIVRRKSYLAKIYFLDFFAAFFPLAFAGKVG